MPKKIRAHPRHPFYPRSVPGKALRTLRLCERLSPNALHLRLRRRGVYPAPDAGLLAMTERTQYSILNLSPVNIRGRFRNQGLPAAATSWKLVLQY